MLAIAAMGAVAQQNDEVHVSGRPYTPPQLHLTAQTSLVQLEVVVRDPRGQSVGGLKQDDFEILDEGKPRGVSAFSVVTRASIQAAMAPAAAGNNPGAPAATPQAPPVRSTLLFFDDLHEGPGELQRTQAAARRFVRDGMGPGARAAIYASSDGIKLDFTADSDALLAAIGKLRSHQRVSENGLQPCPRITPYQAFLIDNNLSVDALNAAVQEAQQCANAAPSDDTPNSPNQRVTGRNPSLLTTMNVNPAVIGVRAQATATWQQSRADASNSLDAVRNALGLLSRAPGTRVLLMVSTGFLTGMMDVDRATAIDAAIHAGIVINSIDAKGLWSEAPERGFGQEAQTTGVLPHATFMFENSSIGSRNDAVNEVMQEFASGTGGLFFHNNNDLVGGFAQLGAVPETTYLLAFRPDEGAAGKYHKLKVRLAAKNDDYVQTRPGYFAPSGAVSADGKTDVRPLDAEVQASGVLADIPVRVTTRVGKTDKGDTAVSTLIHVDIAPLKFAQRGDRHVQRLSFVGVLLDGSGKMLAAKEGAMDLALKDDTLAKLTASGMNAGLTFPVPPGAYRVRVVVQDAEGKMAAQNLAVEIPK